MQHHKHAGLAGRLSADGTTLEPHPDASHPEARMAWIPLASPDGREIEALEGVMCIPTRPGAMRLAAVPHVAENLALGDELAVADWDGEPLARGELALALSGTIRVIAAAPAVDADAATATTWQDLAATIDDAAGGRGSCWFDAIGDSALAVCVPRASLGAVFAQLTDAAARDELRWEYVTPLRHVH